MATDAEIVYFGGYTPEAGGQGEGIQAARRDPVSGELEPMGVVAATPAPSFLVRHPRLSVLYAVNELPDGRVSAWAEGDDGGLRPLGEQSTGGSEPCHLAVLAGGEHLASANYGSGSIAVHPLDGSGRPGERTDLLVHEPHGGPGRDPQRQDGPHAHMVSADPSGESLLAVDLGMDSIYHYQLDKASARLVPTGPRTHLPAGTGPRHLARHPDRRRCFVVGELSAAVFAYELDQRGALHERGRVPASRREGRVQPSEVAVHPNGRFLYVANRGVDTISVFAVDANAPRLLAEVDSGGAWARHFALIGQHLYVANERSHTIGVFRLDEADGRPVPTGTCAMPSPTCVLPPRRDVL
ncbi:MAG TPA: lactonase family protein [Micromonosporaceae bacterium]|nr:lactonase family protein [Micromonosporaceae bacterium]